MDEDRLIFTFSATVIFCVAFYHGRLLDTLNHIGRRVAISAAGGAAVAYVFVHLLPEIEAAAELVRENTRWTGPLISYAVHVATMVGFVVFYGVEELIVRKSTKDKNSRIGEAARAHPLFVVHIVAFFGYAWLVGYLLVRPLESTFVPMGFYAAAMTLHFLSVAYGLRREHGVLYSKIGAPVLAAGAVSGWGSGIVLDLPHQVVAGLFGLLAGGIIANTMISELPREKEGKFLPFVIGALVYTVLLLLAV